MISLPTYKHSSLIKTLSKQSLIQNDKEFLALTLIKKSTTLGIKKIIAILTSRLLMKIITKITIKAINKGDRVIKPLCTI